MNKTLPNKNFSSEKNLTKEIIKTKTGPVAPQPVYDHQPTKLIC